jgi:VWFA-related protein
VPRNGEGQRRIALGVAAIVTAASLLSGQTPPAGQQPDPPTPRFRAAADVVVVEATVLDRKGAVVTGLEPADFKVEISGKPREIVSVDMVEYAPPSTEAATVAVDPEITTNDPKELGRIVLLVIDRGSLSSDTKSVIESARKWVLAMPPKDQIGLLTFPAPGPSVDFTTEHAKVAEALTRVVGVASQTPPFQQYNVSIWEAIRMEALDLFVRQDVVGRECRANSPLCPTEIDMQVKTMLQDAQAQIQPVLRSLRATMRGLAAVPGPKHAVLLSSGWAMNERDASIEMGWVAADAARANVTIHTFTAEMWALAASRSRPSMRSVEDRNLLMNNVEMLAGMTGGRSVRLAGQADTAFASLSAGLSGYYRLGVQVLPEDLDGKDRRISVKVGRPGVSLASYRRVMSGARPKADAPVDSEAALRDALKGGPVRTGVDLRATSYVLHATTDPKHVRVVAVGDVNRAAAGAVKAVAALYDVDGRPITAMENTVDVGADRPGLLSVELTAPPGTYVLRVAVLDAEGRIGSLERLVDARWKKTGGIETPGLVLFRSDRAARSAPRPIFDGVTTADEVTAQLVL